jgi:hypothetical protein
LKLVLLRYTELSALSLDAAARKLMNTLFSQSAPCHPPNANTEAVATRRDKILRLQTWFSGDDSKAAPQGPLRPSRVHFEQRDLLHVRWNKQEGWKFQHSR